MTKTMLLAIFAICAMIRAAYCGNDDGLVSTGSNWIYEVCSATPFVHSPEEADAVCQGATYQGVAGRLLSLANGQEVAVPSFP